MSGGCLSGWLAGGRRSVKAVPVVYSRFAALWGTFRLSTPSEGVGFRAVSLLLPKECRGTFAVCCVLWHIPAFYSFRRSRVFGCFRYSFRRSAGVHSRFAALCGPFRLSTPSEGVGFLAVFATPSEGVRGNVRTSGMRHGVLSGCPGHRGGNLRAAVTDSRCQ